MVIPKFKILVTYSSRTKWCVQSCHVSVNKNKKECSITTRSTLGSLKKTQNILGIYEKQKTMGKVESNIFHTSETARVDLMVKNPVLHKLNA